VKKALITAEIDDHTIEELNDLGYEVEVAGWGQTHKALSEQEFIARVADIALLVVEVEQITEQVIRSASKLELIHVCRSGPGNVNLEAATACGIPVLVTPGRNADSVADFTVGMLLGITRQISSADEHLKRGGWSVENEIPYFHFRGPEFAGKTIGLIGCGAIGGAFLKRMGGFMMRTLIYDPYVKPETLTEGGELVDLGVVLQQSDFIVILCPLTQETMDMIGSDEIAKLKPTSYLINTARAAVVNEKALFEAVESRRIAGAALDVFWQEPLPMDSPWRSVKNVLITPHIAGASDEVRTHQGNMLIEDLHLLRSGEIPQRVVNPSVVKDRKPI
jgi:phosphoglycerate dehydrogenase-like enzyme